MVYKVKKLIVSFVQFKRAFVNYPFRKFNFVEILLFWTRERLTRSQFLILSGILVGLTAGLGGVLLKVLVHHIHSFVNNEVPFEERIYIFAIFPLLGIVLTTLIVKYLFKGDEDKELSNILKDISQNGSKVKSNKMYSQIIQSAVTVGFGGSVGLETPIAVTGSAVGSNYAQRYRLGFKERTLLLASGASAGIAAAFDAPIAGVMFAFEILLVGLVFTDFIPLVIAAICGSLLSMIILNDDVLFNLPARETFNYGNIPYYVGLGVLTGFYARYFLVVGIIVKWFLGKFKKRVLLRAIIGGGLLSLLCVAFPPLYGEGYLNIRMLHQGNIEHLIHESLFRYFEFESSQWTIIAFLGLTVLMKAFATSITLSSGGNGGNFAPSLVAGGLLGYLFGFVLEMMGMPNVPTTNLMLVGMAGVMSGALYAPLTAIFLIAETSSGYDLFIPLMVVSVTAYAINRFFSPTHPSYKKLAERGEIFTTRQDQNILSHINLQDCLNTSSLIIKTTDSMEEVLRKFRNSDQNTMAIVDTENKFWGILNRERLRPFLLGKESTRSTSVSDLATSPSFIISNKDSVMEIMKMFDEADVWQLPMLDEERKFQGFVSRSAILNNYRKLLREYSE
ncbi:chloride channel protein [Aequorivita viscosa]|uniref:Chloride channel protein, CIC family n=1 Tax=Aequorivita viscosa TaxID=797419 RepID=A0A1M6C6R8_9FLAO|nr:chloride channel protein [Aequorivita viscosa]SDW24420.1 chloride channel protein, CIC family [Aequorivita viscosa]SHI56682.1 chloride channel protein, CIC family [Aequorivita viscosa]